MIRKIRALLTHPDVATMIAMNAVMWGATTLMRIVSERQEQLEEIDAAIVDRTALLRKVKAELGAAMGAEVPYPTPADVDPLGSAKWNPADHVKVTEFVAPEVDAPAGVGG